MRIEEREITKKDIDLNLNTHPYDKGAIFKHCVLFITFLCLSIISLTVYILRKDGATLMAFLVFGSLSGLGVYIFIDYRKKKNYQNKSHATFLCPKCYMVMDDNEEHTIYSCYVCNFRILDPDVKFYKHFSNTLSWTKEDLKWEKFNITLCILFASIAFYCANALMFVIYNKKDGLNTSQMILGIIISIIPLGVFVWFLYNAIISNRKLMKSPK